MSPPSKKAVLIANYHVHPIIHSRLLPTITGKCQCGKPLTGEFYEFHFQEKTTPANEGTFLAGPDCGAKIMSMIGHANIPFVDPLSGIPTTPTSARTTTTPTNTAVRDPLNLEVLQVIALIRVLSNRTPTGNLLKTLQFAMSRPNIAPVDWSVATLNAYVRQMLSATGQTLSQAIATKQGGKTFKFPLAAAALQRGQQANAALPQGSQHIKPPNYFTDCLN